MKITHMATHLARFEREQAARALKVPQDMIDPYFDEIAALKKQHDGLCEMLPQRKPDYDRQYDGLVMDVAARMLDELEGEE